MIDKPISELELDDLNRIYKEGEEADKSLFAEMRTNSLLVSGQHYTKEGSKYWNRVRTNKQLSAESRLKLTKNHIQRVTKLYRNAIEAYAPGVAFTPANENQLSDQKSAQLNESYWKYVKVQANIDARIAEWIQHFIEYGEVHCKVIWEPEGGQVIGYEQAMAPHPETGEMEPQVDEMGNPVQGDKACYGGKLLFETLEGYNVRRDKAARTLAESPYLILCKLRPKSTLYTWIKDEETRKKIEDAPIDEYQVFDNNTGRYSSDKEQVLVKEIYFRPAPTIPEGYYFIFTGNHKIAEGPLPYGIFPVISELFDTQVGNARGHSVIRHIRPAQIEINRCASVIAETQVTMGWDKVWVQANTKVAQGSLLPGLRVNTYTGMKPEVTPGRTGDQYFSYLDSQINELYRLANLEEILESKQDSSDLYTNLFKSFRFRQKFAIYGQKFERFLIKVVETALEIARHCVSEAELIPAVGRNEQINVAEFKSSQPLSYRVKLEPRSDDIESQFGKQITLNHAIQYIGPNLGKEEIGQMLRLSPFLNGEQMFKRFTQKYDRVVNDVLAMDRGQFRPPRKYDDHDYIIQALSTRMAEPDYEYLPQPIQYLYEQKMAAHEKLKAQQLQELQMAEAGWIPTGGFSVACDFYITKDAKDPQKTQRVRVPSEALNWLIEKLKVQGAMLDPVMQMPGGVQQDLAQMTPPPQPSAPGAPYGDMNAARPVAQY